LLPFPAWGTQNILSLFPSPPRLCLYFILLYYNKSFLKLFKKLIGGKGLSQYLAVAKSLPKENDFCNKDRIRHNHGNWTEHGFKIFRKLCAASIA
jgi:hypothetical protein